MLKFAGKWMELEETILSEVTQSQKDKHGMHSLIYGFIEQKITSLQSTLPEKPGNKDDSKRDIHDPREKGKGIRSSEQIRSMGRKER